MNINRISKKKIKLIFYISSMALLITTFLIVNKDNSIKQTEAKQKLEDIVNKSYNETKQSIEVPNLAENIEKEAKNDTKIINPKTTKFPILTTVNGYDFKVEENGNIEENTKTLNTNNNENTGITSNSNENIENIVLENTTQKNIIQNNTNNETNSIIQNNVDIGNNIKNQTDTNVGTLKEINLNCKEESKTFKGVTITTNKDGSAVLNGTSQDKIFMKITNGIDMTTDGNVSSAEAKKEPIIIEKGKNIKIEVKEISGTAVTNSNLEQCNVVSKYNDGIIATNCKLKSDIFNIEINTQKDISMVYIFVSSNIIFNNYKIKIGVYYNS